MENNESESHCCNCDAVMYTLQSTMYCTWCSACITLVFFTSWYATYKFNCYGKCYVEYLMLNCV